MTNIGKGSDVELTTPPHLWEPEMKKLIAVSMLLVLSACGSVSGRLGDLPAVSNRSAATKVVTIRVSSIVASANGFIITLDRKELYGIGSGEHAEFLAPEGEHQIAVKYFGGWSPTWKETPLSFTAKAGETAFFVISPGIKGAEIEQTTEAEAKKYLRESKAIDLEKLVSTR